MKDLSIKSKLLVVVIATIIIVAGLISIESIYSIKSLTKDSIEEYKGNAFKAQEENLKTYTKFAKNVVEHFFVDSEIDKIKENVKDDLETQMNFLFKMLDELYNKLHGKVSDEQLQRILLDTIGSAKYGKKTTTSLFIMRMQ